ncbi:hypothetical protein COPRO5265_01905 [Coprothermobacter proteolyticus DSM 5265]|nr:hypothetical protein COPRO5265_01905 [Coprothermobacter proteolyticus DSM 5265]
MQMLGVLQLGTSFLAAYIYHKLILQELIAHKTCMQLIVANVCAVNKQTKGIPDFEKRLNGIYLNESRPKKVC